ncbi:MULTISPECIES: hypothetical protein [unclassified Streptomyces]|uniref:hypothetical protein n=1 Tax=unclassified Streptomyces TaxID=2593676 RepID=UPI0033F7DAF9
MGDDYSANMPAIVASSGGIGEGARLAGTMLPGFESAISQYDGCWGVEGDGDLFADQVGPQAREERDQVVKTLGDVANGYVNLASAVLQEAQNVQRPQNLAMEDIASQSAESETRR